MAFGRSVLDDRMTSIVPVDGAETDRKVEPEKDSDRNIRERELIEERKDAADATSSSKSFAWSPSSSVVNAQSKLEPIVHWVANT